MQELLVVLSIVFALYFLARNVYIKNFTSKKKCDGCVVNKLYQAKSK